MRKIKRTSGQRGPREGIFGYGHDRNNTSGVMDKGCKGRRVPGYNGIIQNRSAVRDHTDYNKTELHKVAQVSMRAQIFCLK